MTLGIQKLNSISKVTVQKPPFASSGMDKPVNQIARMQLGAWPTPEGELSLGPGRPGNSLINGASKGFTGKWAGIVITMWIRTASNRGGPILAFHRAVTGTDTGPQAAGTDSLDISEGADGVSGGGSEWLFPLNFGNDGWHHIELRFGSPNELYVDGRFKTPSTSASLGTLTSGFDALHIGGRMVNFLQGVTDYTKNFSWDGGTQQFDIAQLAVHESGPGLYPFYDLGAEANSGDQYLLNAGKAPGTFTAPASNTEGNAHPYPIIYIPFDDNNFSAVGGWGDAGSDSDWFGPGDLALHPNGVVPTYGGSLIWYDITGKTSGVVGNGPLPSGSRTTPA